MSGELVLICAVKAVTVFSLFMVFIAWVSWMERKVAAIIQDRVGPNRVGPKGLLQPIVDAIKLIQKEDLIPGNVHAGAYVLAPIMVVIPALITFAVIPLGPDLNLAFLAEWLPYVPDFLPFVSERLTSLSGRVVSLQVSDISIGVLFILAVGSLGVYGMALAGWSSNNKYGLLGGVRSSAQMISYELALGLAVISVLIQSGDLRMSVIVERQNELFWGFFPAWNAFLNPLAFLVFFVAAFAETNRLPFDLPEAEPELVAGYHIEYSSMKFAMFMMAESAAMTTMAALIVTLFLGGWSFPWISAGWVGGALWQALFGLFVFGIKMFFVFGFFLVLRWTIPRFRYDQLMDLGWKRMVPLALVALLLAVGVAYVRDAGSSPLSGKKEMAQIIRPIVQP